MAEKAVAVSQQRAVIIPYDVALLLTIKEQTGKRSTTWGLQFQTASLEKHDSFERKVSFSLRNTHSVAGQESGSPLLNFDSLCKSDWVIFAGKFLTVLSYMFYRP